MNINIQKLVFWKNSNFSFRETLNKFSRGLFVTVSIMPLAGLFLGIGATIVNNVAKGSVGADIGTEIQNLGQFLFDSLGLFFAIGIAMSFANEKAYAAFAAALGYFAFAYAQSVFIKPVTPGANDTLYNIFFYKDLSNQIASNFIGSIVQVQTSVFGGMVIGGVVAKLYNRFSSTQLPILIQFFSGERFVGIIVIPVCALIGIVFLLIWPLFSIGLNWVGENSGKLPGGLDSLIFGILERCLVPFGLHHVFYAPLWWTGAGGSLDPNIDHIWIDGTDKGTIAQYLQSLGLDYKSYNWQGDSKMWFTFQQLGFPFRTADNFYFTHNGERLDLNLGRFMQGKYPFMIFGLSGAAYAMIMAAPKEKRVEARTMIISAASTSFLLGITEPIEYTFLLLAPILFFGFHAIMAGISFMLMNLLGANIGMTLSGGMVDLLVYGVLPMFNHSVVPGQNLSTGFWWVFVIGVPYAFIYYFVFYFYITKKDIPTPGRVEGAKLASKAEYQAVKSSKKASSPEEDKAKFDSLTKCLGGKSNIKAISNCASRLRITVVDSSKVEKGNWAAKVGAFGINRSKNEIQIIYGNLASIIKVKYQSYYDTI